MSLGPFHCHPLGPLRVPAQTLMAIGFVGFGTLKFKKASENPIRGKKINIFFILNMLLQKNKFFLFINYFFSKKEGCQGSQRGLFAVIIEFRQGPFKGPKGSQRVTARGSAWN